ncbi:MAG: sulfatase-like hydrolase/transferase [Halobacteriales archaeon]
MTADGATNVLFVVMDTVRKDHLSVYGYDRETTPALEALAAEAATFEEALAPAPWTLPVHASMFTGQYPSEHGASQEDPYLEGATTLAESLDRPSACYSSNAWITPYTGLTAGFSDQNNFFQVMPGEFLSGPLARAWRAMNDNDALRGVADRLVEIGNRFHEHFAGGEGADSKTPRVIDRTIEFIDGHEEYFAFINLMDAHLPYHPPEEYASEFAPGVDSTEVCQNSKEYNSGARAIDDEEWEAIRGLYDAEIRYVDAQLDRLFSWMRENGEWEDTLVVVCADHGELHGEHGIYGHEFCIYDPLVNVPLLVKHPDLPAERRTDQVELVDLYHTVLDAAGATGGGNSTAAGDGADPVAPGGEPFDPERSLLSPSYREFEGSEVGFVEYYRPVVELNQLESKAKAAGIDLDRDSRFYSRMRAARRTDAKYIHNERIDDEFYRLDADPGEAENRVGEGDSAEDELAAALEAFAARVGAEWGDAPEGDVLSGMDEGTQDRLRDLGYLE